MKSIERLVGIMRRLRAEGGCPWDREQTLDSLKPNLIEETYEIVDAIDNKDYAELQEELGDVLLQVVFMSQICSEQDRFDLADVAEGISDKLVRRHPHVFGDLDVADSEEVLRNWNAIKRKEHKEDRTSAVGNMPRHLPALQKANHVQKEAARVGFDWDNLQPVIDKIEEELQEVKDALEQRDADGIKEEIGDLLFSVVNLSRFKGHCAEDLLNQTIKKFVRRFRGIEEQIHEQGREITEYTLSELDTIWESIKAEEKQKSS